MVQAISSILPSFIFSTRRTNNGLNAADEHNPAVALMNWNIATGQMFKAAKETVNAAKGIKNNVSAKILSAESAIKELAHGDKILEGAEKVVKFTSDHINPLICATGAVKVACSDDKQSALIQEVAALSGMFGFEKSAKILLGLPHKRRINGVRVRIQEEAKLKTWTKNNVFVQKQLEAIKESAKTSEFMAKAVKYAPGIIKGLGFVIASIAGYKLGSSFGGKIAEYVKNKQAEKNSSKSCSKQPLLSITRNAA